MRYSAFFKATLAACLLIASANVLPAQCNNFVKKKCNPKIQPFTSNGQMNTTVLSSGQSSSLNMTCYSGQAYRVLVCSESALGTPTFKVMDKSRKVLFDSKANDSPDFWDFKAKSTQEFTVEVTVPPSESTSSVLPSGCVSVMVGFKKD